MSLSPAHPDAAHRGGFRATLRHRDFTKLWVGQIVSSTGDCFYQFALLHLILGNSAGLIGAVGRDAARIIFCGMILPVVLARWIGFQVDHKNRRGILFWTEAGRGIIALAMLVVWSFHFPLPWLLALVALSGLLTGLFIPARQAVLPMLVPANHLVRANALMTFAGIAATLAGASAGLAITLLGEKFSFFATAAGFAFSSVMIARIRTPLLPAPDASITQEARDGKILSSRSAVRVLVWLVVAFTFVNGLFLPFFAEQVARAIDCTWLNRWISGSTDATFAGVVVLLGITGAGLFGGMLTAGQIPRLAHWRPLPVLMLGVWGAAIWKLGTTSAYAPASLLCLVAGWATGLITIPADARLQHEVAGERHGRVFARRLALSNIAFLAGLAVNLNGRLLRAYGSEMLLGQLGLLAIALAIVFILTGGKALRGSWGTPALAAVDPAVPSVQAERS